MHIYMFKRIFILVIFILLILGILTTDISAESEFIIDSNVSYIFTEDGKSKVIQKNTLENIFSTLYAKSYTLKLENIDVEKVRAYDNYGDLKVEQKSDGDLTIIDIIFSDTLIGKGEKREFTIEYEVNNLADKTGKVWEIIIPKLQKESAYRNYSVEVLIPKSFGEAAYLSPKPIDVKTSNLNDAYIFSKNSLLESGISMGFGEFQVFDYTLIYHLENPLNSEAETEISIPPDTAFQKVFITNIEPEPIRIEMDEDGNWLAKYTLSSRERIDVTVNGAVQIFSQPKEFIKPTDSNLQKNLMPSSYWQTYDEDIKKLATSLGNATNIYNFVTKKLVYDYDRVKPNVERLGASKALEIPENAICMEYTDLFIAISRAAGIPAREINGFAYTENPEIQPISLVADVLHAWPEYWDTNKQVWIPVDPTWGSTTKGVDFFNKLDLRHFTFVIHGTDPLKPYAPGSYKLGPNPQKDVFVNFGKLPQERESHIEITSNQINLIPYPGMNLNIKLINKGPVALYDVKPKIYFDNKIQDIEEINYLLPFSEGSISLVIPFSFFAINTPNEIKVSLNSNEIIINNIKHQVIIFSLIMVFIPLVIIFLIMLLNRKYIKSIISKNKYQNESKEDKIKQEIT